MWYLTSMSTTTTLVLLSDSPEEARAAHDRLNLSPPPDHNHSGLNLLDWAQAEDLESCPLCSSPVGSAHLSVCRDHYAGHVKRPRPPMYHFESESLLADGSRIRLAHPNALPDEIPDDWSLVSIGIPAQPHTTLAPTGPTHSPTGLHVLRSLGYDNDQIVSMTTAECIRIIRDGVPASRPANVLNFQRDGL